MSDDYSPKDIQTAIKTCWALIIVIGLLFISLVAKNSRADAYIDVSLGSMVGGVEQPESGQMPFWGEIGIKLLLFDLGIGHRSNADYNGNETDYEYAFIGRSFGRNSQKWPYLPLYGRLEAQHAFSNDLKDENILSLEGGFRRGDFRFGAFHETASTLNIQGLKAGYTF